MTPDFKPKTFLRKRNVLRDAIRREGPPAIQDAWDAFEGYTDCLTMEDAQKVRDDALEEALHAAEALKPRDMGEALDAGADYCAGVRHVCNHLRAMIGATQLEGE